MKRVKAAIESGDQNLLFTVDIHGFTLLLEAGDKKRLLVGECENISALHLAADKGHVDSESVRQLIEAGGMELVLLRNMGGQTALHYAAREGHEAAARMLIKAGGEELVCVCSGHLPTLEEEPQRSTVTQAWTKNGHGIPRAAAAQRLSLIPLWEPGP